MKKIWIIIAGVLILFAAWGIRFYLVNKDVDAPVIQVYEKGEEVPIGEDFFDYESEGMDGYTITVLDAELLSVADFLQKYDAVDQAENLRLFTDYIYTVHILAANRHNPYTGEKGVALQQYVLQGTNYILSLEDTCYRIANPDMPGTSFSLREGTDMEITLTFDVMSRTTNIQHILDDSPKLLITQYPHKKMIENIYPVTDSGGNI